MSIRYRVDGATLEDVFDGYFPEHVPPETVVQVKVSCQGDIAVQRFYPEDCDGVAWLLLSQGPKGEVGRDINGEVDEGPRLLGEQPGIFIGATDPESLTVIIEALETLRDKLAGMDETEQSKGLQDIVTRDDLKVARSVEEIINTPVSMKPSSRGFGDVRPPEKTSGKAAQKKVPQ